MKISSRSEEAGSSRANRLARTARKPCFRISNRRSQTSGAILSTSKGSWPHRLDSLKDHRRNSQRSSHPVRRSAGLSWRNFRPVPLATSRRCCRGLLRPQRSAIAHRPAGHRWTRLNSRLIERFINRDQYILHQNDELTSRVSSLSDNQIHPLVIDLLKYVGRQEAFWLDITSPRLYSLLLHSAPCQRN